MSSKKASTQEPQHVAVVGAGLAGTMTAALLCKLGFKISVFEKRSDEVEEKFNSEFGTATSATKRSINLALSYRGIKALGELGLVEKVLENAIRMPCRVIHNRDGSIKTQAYGKGDETLWSVGRGTLNNILKDYLLEVANRTNSKRVSMHFDYHLHEATSAGHCTFHDHSGNHLLSQSYDLVIGADGAFSAVRDNLLKSGRINFSRQYVRHGYKELTIPAVFDANGKMTWALSNHEGLHIWPRGNFMLIALPNPDFTFTVTLFAPQTGEDSFESINKNDASEILRHFNNNFPDIVPLLTNLVQEYRENPVGSLQTLKVDPWNHGKLMVVGDAAHAIVPFYGQGMNAAFQDGYMLYQVISEYLTDNNSLSTVDLAKCAKEFSKIRQPATNALADLCLEHYHDMASNTASSLYLLHKKVEGFLHHFFPTLFIPEYTMIAFMDLPYHDAVERAHRQNVWLGRVYLVTSFTLGFAGLRYCHQHGHLRPIYPAIRSVLASISSIFK